MASAQSPYLARSWKRLDGVDILRGLAIVLVLMNHVNMQLLFAKVPYTRGLPPQLVSSLVWNGQRGVQIFFAVSGFLITSTTLRRWGPLSQVRLLDFYRMRLARIVPLLVALLAILSLLHLMGVPHFVISAKTGGLGRALAAALTFHINVLEAKRGYLPGSWDILWSLSVEEVFYLFFPILCRLFGRGKLLIAILLTFVLLGPFARTVFVHGNEVWLEYSYLGGMDAIALGCLTAIATAKHHLSRVMVRCLAVAGIAVLIFSVGLSIQAVALRLGRLGLDMTVLAIGVCMVIAAASQSDWRSPLILSPLRKLGQRSYEVYLTHMFLVLLLFSFFTAIGKPLWLVPVLFLVLIACSGLLGELVARFYSEPMNRWLRNRWGEGPSSLGSLMERDSESIVLRS